jgi:hypothetical protein
LDSQTHEQNETAAEPQYETGLEQKFIIEFLQERGLTLQDLKTLTPDEARKIRVEASRYATARLAELEARARFISTIHDATHNATS